MFRPSSLGSPVSRGSPPTAARPARRRPARVSAIRMLLALLALSAISLPGSRVRAADLRNQPRRTPVVRVVEETTPAVVNISTDIYESRPAYPFFGPTRDPFFDQFFNRFFGPPARERFHRQSLGSGVLIDREGHILTNHHVILKASKIHVTLASGKEYEAGVVGSDPTSDLAVLKIDPAEPLHPVRLGTSSDLMIGETVVAIGNPFGLSHSVTTGVISALNRSIQSGELVYKDFIQTDASINPGNSGGPLLNIRAELIGINTAIYSEAQGIGFAIPVDRAKRIMDDLIHYGEVQPAWFGIEVQALNARLAKYLGYGGRDGVLVTEVYQGSPAARAGIRVQDILVKAGDTVLSSPREYARFLRRTTVNDEVTFQVFRKGKMLRVKAKGAALPEEMLDRFCRRALGIQVRDLTNRALLGAGIRGVEIAQVFRGTQAERIGLRPGDVVLKIDDRDVPDVKRFRKALSRLRGRSNVTLQVLRGRYLYYVTLELGVPFS